MELASVAASMCSAVGNTGAAVQSPEEQGMPEVPCTAVMSASFVLHHIAHHPGGLGCIHVRIQACFSLIGHAV